MATLRSCIGSALALSILLSGVTAAQQPKQESAPERQSEPDFQRTNNHNTTEAAETGTGEYLLWRIILLLRSTAEESKKWDDRQLTARVQSEVADLTWEADPYAAGVLLQTAWDTARDIRNESHPESAYRTTSPKTEALQSVIMVAHKRAPELARKWIDQISDDGDEGSSSPRGVFDDRSRRSSVLLQMAAEGVDRDPKAAAELAKESLNDGISFGLQIVLIALQTRDFSLARQVFQAALSRLRSVGMQDPNELLILASYLYTPGKVMGANRSANRGGFPLSVNRNPVIVTSAAQLEPGMASDFLSLAADLLLTAPLPSTTPDPVVTARSQVNVIDVLAGRIAEAFPEQGQALRQREVQIALDAKFALAPPPRPTGAPPRLAAERPRDYAERRVDTLEESARKESSPMARDLRYAEAALATAPADYQRGWSLAQNVQDEELRPALKNLVSYRAAVSFAAANRLDKLEEVNARSTDHLYRAAALVLGAQRMIAARNTSRAGEWLVEASQTIRKAAPEEALVRVAFGVAAAYAGFDGLLAGQALAEALKLLDKFPSVPLTDEKAPMTKRFSGISFSDFTYGTTGFGLNSVIAAIPSAAFEDVLGQLGRLSKPESRGLSIILLCRSHLARVQPHKPAPGQPESTPAAAPPAVRKSSER